MAIWNFKFVLILAAALDKSGSVFTTPAVVKVEVGGVALTNGHFARLKAMMSLSHGWAKFSGRAKQRKGR